MTPKPGPEQIERIRQVYDLACRTEGAGDDAGAELICRRALPEFGRDPNILCLLGEIVLKQRRSQEAKSFFGRVLKLYPNFPRALEGMGRAHLRDRKPAKAVKYLQQVLAAMPDRPSTLFLLGKALAATGQGIEAEQAVERAFKLDPKRAALARAFEAQRENNIVEAEQILREILKREPDEVTALRMLGSLATEANKWGAAERLLQRAVELAPDFILAWNDLATLYLQQEVFDKALDHVEHAIQLDPKLPFAQVIRGNVLSKAQRHEEALASYREALDLSPGHGGALSGIGHVLKTIGRQDESIAAYRECIRAHPALGEAYWSLANLKTFEFDDEEVRVMQHMVEDDELADEPKVNFYLSLGKHFENCSDYDRAFEHYRLGNELRRTHETYDPVQTQVIHDRIIEVFTPEFLANRADCGDPSFGPILIVGLPRSGSTLIEQILASHSQVEGTMELPDLSRLIRDINRNRKDGQEYPEVLAQLSQQDFASLGQKYLETTQRYRTGKAWFVDKMPNNFASIGFLHLILPNAKVINARRHPLDSCMGCYKQLFYKGQSFTYDQFELGQYYLQYQRIVDHWHAVLPGKVLDLQYEDMVLDQENQTRRLLEYCGLTWEDQCLRFYETDRAINTASSEQVRQPIYTKALNYWRHYEDHLGELIEILEPLLKDLPEADRPRSLQG